MTSLSTTGYMIQGTLNPHTDDKLAFYKNTNSMKKDKTYINNNMIITEYAKTIIVTLEKGTGYTTSCGIVGIYPNTNNQNSNVAFHLPNIAHHLESSISLKFSPKKITIDQIMRMPQADYFDTNEESQPSSSVFGPGYGTLVLFGEESYEFEIPKNSYIIFTDVTSSVYCIVTITKPIEIFQKTKVRSIFFQEAGKLTIWTDIPDYTIISFSVYTNKKFESFQCEEIIILGGQENYTIYDASKQTCIYGINTDGYFFTTLDTSNFEAYSISGYPLEPQIIYRAPVFIYNKGANSFIPKVVQTLSFINQRSFLYNLNSNPDSVVTIDDSGTLLINGSEHSNNIKNPFKIYSPDTLPEEKSDSIVPAIVCLVIYIVIIVVLIILSICCKSRILYYLESKDDDDETSIETQQVSQADNTKPSELYFNDVIIQMSESSELSSESGDIPIEIEEFH
ncbi:hypothetical protein TVAG_044990 [Trichomonas vaginalis G3]|uniref:Uncharacterized protein n=1 Tax=Trichomonas vaginalis (strain ATCC PRA-98 / G3) TaxID=412133 RepID=A2E8E7_TRIV3|nr:hypothetical protein TVAGG3_0550790 [Trichomonas vaginalis G3]EAY11075.1 hypothetical protein TVAG_044990 [Trichomonas vaginalis G3]KAI5520488.1 hypothetical protein TVAGG3_0550790 [Trichomonas vaginalis G3]|eukprot:XP_001323298.1 hypothetical protein [Trichomonas vaginalis G3]